jgi:hypothetical protein
VAAVRREASQQPAGEQEANGREGASRQEAMASRKPADERQRFCCKRTHEGGSAL